MSATAIPATIPSRQLTPTTRSIMNSKLPLNRWHTTTSHIANKLRPDAELPGGEDSKTEHSCAHLIGIKSAEHQQGSEQQLLTPKSSSHKNKKNTQNSTNAYLHHTNPLATLPLRGNRAIQPTRIPKIVFGGCSIFG